MNHTLRLCGFTSPEAVRLAASRCAPANTVPFPAAPAAAPPPAASQPALAPTEPGASTPAARRHVCECGQLATNQWGSQWECGRCRQLRHFRESGNPTAPKKPRGVRMRRNLAVHRYDFPPGEDGKRAFNRAYNAALRAKIGHVHREPLIAVRKADYPATPDGYHQYRLDYGAAYRAAMRKAK